MSSWGCPHEVNGLCQKVNNIPCDVGMRGCVLYGRFVFSNPAKNRHIKTDPAHNEAERTGEPGPSSD